MTETVRRRPRGKDDTEFPMNSGKAGRERVLLLAELVFQQHAHRHLGSLAESDQSHPLASTFVGFHGVRQGVFDLGNGGFMVDGRMLR